MTSTIKSTLPKGIYTRLKAIGIYEIVGGFIGLAITIPLIAQTTVLTALVVFLYAIAICLYSYSVYCGIITFKKTGNYLSHSLINQYLQLANFSIVGFGFKYVAGILLSLGIDLTTSIEMKFSFQLSIWQIDIDSGSPNVEINFNLIAFFIIIFIDKLIKKINQDSEVTAIGNEV